MSLTVPSISERRDPEIGDRIHKYFGGTAATDHWAAVLLFCFSLAYLCIFIRHCSFEPDEGIVLQGAERILRGEVPYRDFFTFYTPGSFYLVEFVFKIFGDSMAAARFSIAIAGAGCTVLTFLLARRVCALPAAIFAAFLATVAGCAYRFLVLHNGYSTLTCCICIYSAVRFYENRRNGWALAVGLFSALAFLIEQSKGAGLILGLVIALLTIRYVKGVRLFSRRNAAFLSTGFALPFLATFAYFAIQKSFSLMVQSWTWPLWHYTNSNRVPYGWQNWSEDSVNAIFYTGPWWIRAVKVLAVSPGLVVPALPLIATATLAYWIIRIRAGRSTSQHDGYYVIVCSSSLGLLLSIAATRADVIHFMYLTPIWYVVLAWILDAPTKSRVWMALRPYFATYVAVAFSLLGMALLLNATGAGLTMETRRGKIRVAQRDPVLEYLLAKTSPGQNLLVYPYLPLYNYLNATRSPSRYDFFQPGLNTPQQGQEILDSLERDLSGAVLFEPGFPSKIANSWPGTPMAVIANDRIGDRIARRSRVCSILTSADKLNFEYMVSKDQPCP